MKNRGDAGIRAYGAGILLRQVRSLEADLPNLSASGGQNDIEPIHRLRVASRRLRTALPLFAGCLPTRKVKIWTGEIRRIIPALGAARDLDVQIERLDGILKKNPPPECIPGIKRIRLRLQQKRAKKDNKVQTLAQAVAQKQLIVDMINTLEPLCVVDHLPPTLALYQLSKRAIIPTRDVLLNFGEVIHDPINVLELHAARIAAKWLRYTIEVFTPLYPDGLDVWLKATRRLQELLGDIHDCDVWVDLLPKLTEQERIRTVKYYGREDPIRLLMPGIQTLQQDFAAEREQQYNEMIQKWDAWQEAGLWKELEEFLQKPLAYSHQLYPPAPEPGASLFDE
jgi:CHAD domain-containing protein